MSNSKRKLNEEWLDALIKRTSALRPEDINLTCNGVPVVSTPAPAVEQPTELETLLVASIAAVKARKGK